MAARPLQRKPSAAAQVSATIMAKAEAKKEEQREHKGMRTGCREGETRITCIFGEEEANVLRDYAKSLGVPFSRLTRAMAKRYIAEVVIPRVEANGKLVHHYPLRDDYTLDLEYEGLYADTTTQELDPYL